MEENGHLIKFLYNEDREVVAEETSNGTITRYIRGLGIISSDSEEAKTYYHYVSDEQGSITHVLSEDAEILNHYSYDAFGNIIEKTEKVENRFCYNGEMLDPVTQQYYLRARFYNPVIGRFTQEDTYYGDGLKLYQYCQANPVGYVDPSGHNCGTTQSRYNSDEEQHPKANAAGGYQSATEKGNSKTSYGKSSGKIGDFTELEGSTVDEILDRIPDEAVLRELYPVQGGATEGFEFKWVQNGQTYRVRVHNVDPSAPVGSNAYNGWVVRAQRGRRYFDPTINDFREAKYFNPNGPDYDEVIINDTHIPILDPYQN
jgi:RHS repeat-associated protein